MARSPQRALDGLLAECAEDAACRAAFPELRDEVAAVLRQVEKNPVTVTLTDSETGEPMEIRLTRNVVQGTFLGDFRIRAQQAACAAWPVPPVSREFLDPVVSDVPTLLVSGERDPVTPPVSAERAARTLKNSLHVVVPDGGHGFTGIQGPNECVNSLMIRFVETGTLQGLDTSCMARVKRPEFVLRRDPDVEVPADQLTRLAGTYQEPESGMEIRVETLGRGLRAMYVGDGGPMVLAATSPTRFRVEGLRDTVTFQMAEGWGDLARDGAAWRAGPDAEAGRLAGMFSFHIGIT